MSNEVEKDLEIEIGGNTIIFPATQPSSKGHPRVLCPNCDRIPARKKARKHYVDSHLESSGDSGLEALGGQSEIPTMQSSSKKRPISDVDDGIAAWKKLCGDVPPNIVESIMKSMKACTYEINGHPMILTDDTFQYLRPILPEAISFSKIDVSMAQHKIDDDKPDENLLITHDGLTPEHLSAIESAGDEGLERLMGAVLVAGKNKFEITCAELYCRNSLLNPHAESHSVSPSSVPTNEASTQYLGRLKIVQLPDCYSNWKLVLGVRTHNYLVTQGLLNGEAVVGPSRCAKAFDINSTTKLFIKKERQDVRLLSGDIFRLDSFEFNVPYSGISRNLAMRVHAKNRDKLTLHIKNIDIPDEDDKSEAARLTRDIISVFPPNEKILVITGNEDAEKKLTKLANHFSGIISDKNSTVIARRINRRILPPR
ncbi:hypothetical protein BGX27_011178 [Mortierella sp. AM989]|nr:hypothetical protein BGX27_011178 [Mortierella sp. AM989]